jgi:twinkle protein
MEEQREKALILRPEDCISDMVHAFRHGQEKGTTTYIKKLDMCWTWRKGEFNIWTGYANEGKSIFLRYISLIKDIMAGWRFIFSAPEDFPAKEFFDDIIHTLVGLPTDKDNPYHMTEASYMTAYNMIKDNFIFLYMHPPNNTIKGTLMEMTKIIESERIDGIIIDPLIKFARPKDMSERDDIYAAYITTLMTDFARTYNVSSHLVMHQLTPKVLENGFYAKPNMYSIKGGGTWADGTDNILSIWRPKYAKEKLDTSVVFSSQKIKRQKLVGVPQDLQMDFDRRSNSFMEVIDSKPTGKPLFDFDK